MKNENKISLNTLKMIDRSMENFKNGIVGDAIDFDEHKELLEDINEKEKS